MPKNNGHGQAEIITQSQYLAIRKVLKGWHRLFWDIAFYTGERWGAILALKVDDVFAYGKPRQDITFRARTRKADPKGRRQTRQLPISPTLLERLQAYDPPLGEWLFPSSHNPGNHVARRTVDAFLRTALEKCGYESKGISTHSTRRTLITRLDEKGTSIKVIQKITGHKSLQCLSGYIEVSDQRVRQAIACL